ncbi:MAG: HAD hydrolase-like protein [Saprospiraceae bacterium]|nr:HAD hydrolase-like protein [Saprospiraceae bacterium]
MAGRSSAFHYEHVIWDWNGTLLNDVLLCVDIANQLLAKHNDLRLDQAAYREVFGFPITAYYAKIGIDLQKESFDALTQKFFATYDRAVLDCSLHLGAQQLLGQFQNTDKQQYILTAAFKDSVLGLLQHFDIHHFFNEIEGLDNHRAESKVDRGLQLIRKRAIQPRQAVLIGDTLHDFEVAEAIGVDCILVANGHQSQRRLENGVGDKAKVVGRIEELLG